MKNRFPYMFFVLIGSWCTTNGSGQPSSPFNDPVAFNTSQRQVLMNADKPLVHHPVLHLGTDQRTSRERLCRTGSALALTGLGVTALSSALFLTSYELNFNPNKQLSSETRIKNSLILTGLFTGPPLFLAGTVVWIVGKSKPKKNPGE